jgi:hypothetical protein
VSIADAGDDFAVANQDLLVDRIWTTMEDERVCDVCGANAGKAEEDATTAIPAHPVCRCWYREVPRDYQKLAGDQAVGGVGPRSMAFRDPDTGDVVGYVTVDFGTWSQTIMD